MTAASVRAKFPDRNHQLYQSSYNTLGPACAFCNGTGDETILGPEVNICAACVRICTEALSDLKLARRIRTDPMFDEYGPVVARAA